MLSFVSQEQRISDFFTVLYKLVGFFGALEKFLHSGEKCEHGSFNLFSR